MDRFDLPKLAKPALRALQNNGIERLDQLSKVSRDDAASWHGMGPNALRTLDNALEQAGLNWRE